MCEQEGVLGFEGKSVFSCFRLAVFTHDGNGDKKKERRRCGGVDGFYVFMLFSFIWDDYATVDIARRWLMCGKGATKPRVADGNLVVEWKNEEQQSK
jgi:hypothetical protein